MVEQEINDALGAVRALGFAPTTSRMGEAFGSNTAMAVLEASGLITDSTAMPGRMRHDAHRCFDWSNTPRHPYHPGLADYRSPGQPQRRLLEIPMSMAPVRADYDTTPLLRYIDLSFRHVALHDGLRDLLVATPLLVTVTHPSTILPGIASRRHGLLSFEIEEFRRNLDFIFTECARLGREIRCLTLTECAVVFAETRGELPLAP
jgi:hypothetical protein